MYEAKKNKDNSFEYYNKSFKKALDFNYALTKALKNNEYLLYYQPIVNNRGNCIFVEALLRWNSPIHGFIPPFKFISALEKNRQIIEVGFWVIREAIKQIKKINEDSRFSSIGVTINISTVQLADKDFIPKLRDILSELNANTKNINFEIIETGNPFEDPADNTILNNVNAIKELGIGLFLDDFGAGFSSINNILKMPVEYVKIDKFILDKLRIPKERGTFLTALVGILSFIKRIGISVVCEGIEDKLQFDTLKAQTSHCFQGYYFAKPTPDIYELLCENDGVLPLPTEREKALQRIKENLKSRLQLS